MGALNFQAQFAPLVESGEKRQTIRAYRKDGRDPKPGDTLYLYTGMRTKACRKLGEVECAEVENIAFDYDDLEVGNRTLWSHEAQTLAESDGFETWPDMVAWFAKTHGLPFEGLLIRW